MSKQTFMEQKLYIPLLLVAALIAGSRWHPNSVLHYYAAFYILLILYAAKTFKKPLPKGALSVKRSLPFWAAFALTIAGLFLARFLERRLQQFFILTYQDDGVIDVITRTSSEMFLYVSVMMFLMPIGEGLFFRGMIISFENKKKMLLTSILSLILILLVRVEWWPGILVILIPAIPLTVSYLVTKNIYLCMIAHILYSIYDNYEFVGYAIARVIYQYN